MTDQAMSPLRRRMIEDMTIRKFAPKTQHDYLQRPAKSIHGFSAASVAAHLKIAAAHLAISTSS